MHKLFMYPFSVSFCSLDELLIIPIRILKAFAFRGLAVELLELNMV